MFIQPKHSLYWGSEEADLVALLKQIKDVIEHGIDERNLGAVNTIAKAEVQRTGCLYAVVSCQPIGNAASGAAATDHCYFGNHNAFVDNDAFYKASALWTVTSNAGADITLVINAGNVHAVTAIATETHYSDPNETNDDDQFTGAGAEVTQTLALAGSEDFTLAVQVVFVMAAHAPES